MVPYVGFIWDWNSTLSPCPQRNILSISPKSTPHFMDQLPLLLEGLHVHPQHSPTPILCLQEGHSTCHHFWHSLKNSQMNFHTAMLQSQSLKVVLVGISSYKIDCSCSLKPISYSTLTSGSMPPLAGGLALSSAINGMHGPSHQIGIWWQRHWLGQVIALEPPYLSWGPQLSSLQCAICSDNTGIIGIYEKAGPATSHATIPFVTYPHPLFPINHDCSTYMAFTSTGRPNILWYIGPPHLQAVCLQCFPRAIGLLQNI